MKIALTGTIGSGKSAVLKIIADMGFKVLNCDEIAHDLQNKGQAGYRAIIENFNEVLDENGELDRYLLAEQVFNDAHKLAKLNAIMLPLIKDQLIQMMNQYPLVFVEVPLLFESGFETLFDYNILVFANEINVIERLKTRGLSLEEINRRIKSQMDVATKKARADYLIDNSGTLLELENKVQTLLKEMGIC